MSTAQEFEKVLDNSDTTVASFEKHRSPIETAQHFLHGNPAAVPLIVLVLSAGLFGIILGTKFFVALPLILQQVAISGIIGAAQTLVILTAGIDLSVGAIMVLSSVVMGQFTFRYGLPVPESYPNSTSKVNNPAPGSPAPLPYLAIGSPAPTP